LDLLAKLLNASGDMNKHPIMSTAGRYTVNTSKEPWVIDVVDINGEVLFTMPPKRLLDMASLMENIPPAGIAVNIKA
jgi:uncharacterized FlaG/YvyC family protein